MDYYNTLGIKKGASSEEIKKAYRSMAMKHHPDRGGDEKKFKEIEEAYRTLSDPQKKQMYDMGADPNQHPHGGFYSRGPFEFHMGGMPPDMDDLFQNFGFGFRNNVRRNKSISINVEISLEDVLNGKDIDAEISMPSGQKKIININIPPGIEHGQQIKYAGMGDQSINGIRPGDLIVNVYVRQDQRFQREGNNLIHDIRLSAWDAILGTSVNVNTIDGKTLNINIPAGTQPDTILSCKGEGLPQIKTRQRGNLLLRIKIEIPRNLTASQKELIKKIKENGI
jgi:DnaJ-class molecular chaperone